MSYILKTLEFCHNLCGEPQFSELIVVAVPRTHLRNQNAIFPLNGTRMTLQFQGHPLCSVLTCSLLRIHADRFNSNRASSPPIREEIRRD